MNKFLVSLPKLFNRFGIIKLGLIALVIRLVLAIPFHSGDLNNPAIWGIYAREFGFSGFYDFLNFGNYSRPDYPPLAIIFYWIIRAIWEVLFKILWWLNITIPIFPSNLIPWFETDGYILLLKLPGIIGDFLLGVLIYRYLYVKNRKFANLAAGLYWFSPATFYVSSMWGQADGIVMPLAFLSFTLLEQKRPVLGLLAFAASILIKPTMLMVAPIIIFLLLKNKKIWGEVVKSVVISFLFSVSIAWLFAPWNPILWMVTNYFPRFVWGISSNLPYIHLRSFNFWAILTGSGFTSIQTQWLGITLYSWAATMSLIVFAFIFIVFLRKREAWGATSLFIFASFLFLPRIHERYLLPILPFLIVYSIKYPKLLWVFLAISVTHFLNLYAAWQVPFSFIIPIISSDLFYRIGAFTLFLLFFLLLRFYLVLPNKKWSQ